MINREAYKRTSTCAFRRLGKAWRALFLNVCREAGVERVVAWMSERLEVKR